MELRHGIDLVDVARFSSDYISESEGFNHMCFSKNEVSTAGEFNTSERLAGWFAVKEATLKALRFGHSNGLALNEIEVFHDEFGCPFIHLIGQCAELAREIGITTWHVSISHCGGIAMASVIGIVTNQQKANQEVQ